MRFEYTQFVGSVGLNLLYYHDFNIIVSTGSTLTEYAISGNYLDKFIKESAIYYYLEH
jgi:phosphosulfolactate synthase (CoM biosynthesis protein A)